nr:hypothetical protein [uncultured bacterium]
MLGKGTMKSFKLNKLYNLNNVCFGLIAAGVIVRLKHFLENRSLWMDEAHVAVQILGKSFKEILSLEYVFSDTARIPVLFQLVTKLLVEGFGAHDIVFRALPFLSALLGLFLYYRLLKNVTSLRVAALSLAFFAFCGPLVYYAAELKPYSTDVLAAIVLYLAFERIRKNGFDFYETRLFGLIAGVLLWFSFCIHVHYFRHFTIRHCPKSGKKEYHKSALFDGSIFDMDHIFYCSLWDFSAADDCKPRFVKYVG